MSSFEETTNRFEPTRLKAMIDSLRDRFFTVAEFPLLGGEQFPQDVLGRSAKLSESEIRRYASSLKGKELEGLILELRNSLSLDEIKRASDILTIRTSPRIRKLLVVLFQYYESSAAVNQVMKAIAIITEERNDNSRETAFLKGFGAVEDKISAFCTAIEERERDIDRSYSEFGILSQSPFAKRVSLAYLENASKEGLLNNLRWVVNTIESHEKEELRKLIINYLSCLKLSEYHDGINLSILKKIGQPYLSPDWAAYDKVLLDKFAQWSFLHLLKLHSIGYPKKFAVLRKYYKQVRCSYEVKDQNLMVIDFGDIVLADIAERPYSYIYEKSVFEKEMSDWKKSREAEASWSMESGEEQPETFLPAFIRLDKKNLTARDFMIEEMEEACLKLSYEGVDILYIQEMLDIKMGLEPDLRRSQLAKLRRKHSAN